MPYLEKSHHGLQPSNHAKVKSILERAQDDNATGDEQARMVTPCISMVIGHGDDCGRDRMRLDVAPQLHILTERMVALYVEDYFPGVG